MGIVTSIVFLLMLIIPVITMDWIGGSYSDNEQRMLAAFPISVNEETGKLETNTTDITEYINDNIGFRNFFVKVGANVKYNVLNQSTSDKVLLGKDGWMYYTPDNNIEIATGDYPLTDEDLAVIAQNQQIVSDYYKSIGVDYILMLTPSKVSIYPEYLPMSDQAVEKNVVDIVAEYLRENTDVTVYNAKEPLIKAKEENVGQLYHKTDTHWNQLGSYYVYLGLHELMVEKGILSDNPIEATFSEGTYKGEFSKMLGDADLLNAEVTPIANWNTSYTKVTDGETYEAISEVQKKYDKKYSADYLKNDSVSEKCLQIYGDSQLMLVRNIPLLLSEHFNEVVNYRIRQVSVNVDKAANPDIVLYSVSERYVNSLLTKAADVPNLVHSLSLPDKVEEFQTQSHGGMFIRINGEKPETQKIIPSSLYESDDFVTLSGWAADFLAGKSLSELYLKVGDNILKCDYGASMPSVAEKYENNDLTNTGFSVSFPKKYLDGMDHFEFIQIGYDGSYCFQNVRYVITHDNTVYDPGDINLPSEVKPRQTIGYYGMWLDAANGTKPAKKGSIERSLYSGSQTVTLSGWAADFSAGAPLSALYVKLGDKIIQCDYGIPKTGPVTVYENENLLYTGYNVSFPTDYLNNIEVVEFIQVANDGSSRFETVKFQLMG